MTLTAPRFGDLLLNPNFAGWADTALGQMNTYMARIAGETHASLEDATDEDFWSDSSWARPYRVKDGVLYVPVKGMLVHDCGYSFGSWVTGYEYITQAVKRGVADAAVEKIVLVVNSPGGYVAGCFDCADAIYAARSSKPVVAVADEHAYSAAYALASAASEIIVARTGGVGSIGVVAQHLDVTGMLEQHGLKFTFIHAGARKLDGYEEVPLSDTAKARIQARVDANYAVFVSTVARNRGLSEEAVRATEADSYIATEAVEKGLADKVATLDETLSAIADNTGDSTMTAITQAAYDSAVASARAEGLASGMTAGSDAQRVRIAGILDLEEAKTRPAAAQMLAFDTDKPVDAAKTSLLRLPVEAAATTPAAAAAAAEEAPVSAFERLMIASGNPAVGALAAPAGSEATTMSVADRIFASAGAAPRK